MKESEFLDRHSKMQRLNRSVPAHTDDDLDQISFVNQWLINHPDGGHLVTLMLILSIVLFAVGLVMISKGCDKAPQPVAVHLDCRGCHFAPVIKSYSQYKRYHRKPTAADKALAAELKEQEYIISQMVGN